MATVPRAPTPAGTRVLGVVSVLLLLSGCGRSPEVIPEAPPEAVEALVEGLADDQPQVLWYALPPSYQNDIREVIRAFCTHMDAGIYDRTFGVLSKAVRVLEEKQEFIFNSPIALSIPMLESSMGSQWNDTVGLLNALAESELSTMDSLSRMDPGAFLASTGHTIMGQLEDLRSRSQRSPGPRSWEQLSRALRSARVDFLEESDTQGLLRLRVGTNAAPQEVKLTRVEGRWVPTDMAATWAERVEQAKTNLARLSGPEFEKAKPVLSMVLGSLEGALEALLRAESQQEFDATLKSLAAIGGMLQSLKPNP